jgi:serine/threonine protein kinase
LVLYEVLTGKRAFQGSSPASVIAAIMERPAPSIADVAPPALDNILKRCLEKDPDRRWQSVSDLKWALESLQLAESGRQPVPRAARSWLPWTVAAILGLVALAIGGWALWPKAVPETQSSRFMLGPPPKSSFVYPFFGQALSPNGHFLVFAADTESSGGSLWLRPRDSLEAQRLPGTEGGNGTFWSPDGKSIGFVADNKLKRIEIQGGSPQTLCDVGPGFEGGSWSRDGLILFSDGSVIRRVPATGGAATPVTALDTSLSPFVALSDWQPGGAVPQPDHPRHRQQART